MPCSWHREKSLSLLNFSFLPCLYKNKKIGATKSIEKKTMSLSPVTPHCTSAILFCQAGRVEGKMIRIMERYTPGKQEISCPQEKSH